MRRRRPARMRPQLPADLGQLVARWQSQAVAYDLDGVLGHGALLRRVAAELEAVLAARDAEGLTLKDAAVVSGYSPSQLRRLLRLGVLKDMSTNGRIRIARGSLPRKPGRVGGPDLVGDVLDLRRAT